MRNVRVPGDKSITHRALLFASLADGESRIRGALDAADTRSTAAVLHALGIAVAPTLAAEVFLRGRGLRGWSRPDRPLDCGNSGTTARLLMGALAGQPFEAVLTGDESLRSRPMRRVMTPLTQMGATFTELETPDRLPIRMHGAPLQTIDFFSAQSSAQVKSALLLAGLTGDAPVTVSEPRLSRDHTERMLSAMGAVLQRSTDDRGMHVVSIEGAAGLEPLDIDIPGDFSSAAFIIACGLLLDDDVPIGIPDVGLNPGRIGMLEVLRRMKAVVAVSNAREEANEPVGDIRVQRSELQGVIISGDEVPSLIDEIPVLAALAARAAGETRITGASELRVKETDRIAAIVSNMRAIGVEAEELEDGMVIIGTQAALRGSVRTHGDHRIAMAFGVLGALPGNSIQIDEPAAVDVSFPEFWETLARLSRRDATP